MRAIIETCTRRPDELRALFDDQYGRSVVGRRKQFELWLTEARKITVDRDSYMDKIAQKMTTPAIYARGDLGDAVCNYVDRFEYAD